MKKIVKSYTLDKDVVKKINVFAEDRGMNVSNMINEVFGSMVIEDLKELINRNDNREDISLSDIFKGK